jgi:type I restriction enzyme S subunit
MDTVQTLVPKLRFPEFQDAPEWENPTLEEVSIPVVERVGDRKLTPISISAGIGFVPQTEKFGRDISGNQYRFYTLARDGDFVYNKGNSIKFPQGCVYNLRNWGEVAAPNVFICFRLKDGYINNFFQNCFERNMHGVQLQKHITSGARSNGLLNISKDTFFGIRIPTPSTAEQQKIADCLTSLDAWIAAQSQKVEALKAYKKGLMQNLFPAEGESVPRLRFPEFESAGEWEETNLSKLSSCDLSNGVFNDPKKVGGDYKLINVSDMYIDTTINEDNLFLVDISKEEFLRNKVENGDLFFTRSSLVKSGIACSNIYLGYSDDITFDGHLIRFRPNKEIVFPTFVHYLLKTNKVRSQLVARGKTATMTTIGQADVASVKLSFPRIAEQQRIAEFLTTLDEQISAQGEAVAALKVHKKGLMQGLFPNPARR